MAKKAAVRKPNVEREIRLPSDDALQSVARMLARKFNEEKSSKKYGSVKHILSYLGAGAKLSFALAAPQSEKGKTTSDNEYDREALKRFHPYYLRRVIKRLKNQGAAEVGDEGVTLTPKGKHRLLKYLLEGLSIPKPGRWDGKWRIIMYDVSEAKKSLRNVFRQTIVNLGFKRLQGSAWVYPYPCEKEITFLREFFGVGEDVIYIEASRIENDKELREGFRI